ncbi:MAG: CDP-diacylglycerol--serine O-phosphatidyltransferase [Bacteroidales bacterium]
MSLKKYIPNTITSFNLLSGAGSIICTFNNDYEWALLFILFAAIFDFFDGFAARLLDVKSEIGKELDSLADDISFGLAPAILMYHKMSNMAGCPKILIYTPLILAAFSAVRLAKFNIDDRQTESFIGLPTPASSILLSSMICMSSINHIPSLENFYMIPILSILFSILLISNIPMFSLKFHDYTIKHNIHRYIFLSISFIIILVALVFTVHFATIIFLVMLWYMFANIIILLGTLLTNKKN